jgi:hypothetical protein
MLPTLPISCIAAIIMGFVTLGFSTSTKSMYIRSYIKNKKVFYTDKHLKC